ncbi:MAG: hypothetical protein Kow0079_10000 [Vicingaceae bacterium]
MKSKSLVIILLLFSVIGFSQNFIHLDKSLRYKVKLRNNCDYDGDGNYEKYTIGYYFLHYAKDTMIYGNLCLKYEYDFLGYSLFNSPYCDLPKCMSFYVREDTINNKIYAVNPDTTHPIATLDSFALCNYIPWNIFFYGSAHRKETEIFDYNLTAGDTIPEYLDLIYSFSFLWSNITIDSITTINLKGKTRRVWHYYAGQKFIEGIGCDLGVVPYFTWTYNHSFVTCITDTVGLVYNGFFDDFSGNNPVDSICDSTFTVIYIGINEATNTDINDIKIQPTIAHEYFEVLFQTPPNENTIVALYDLTGKRVLLKKLSQPTSTITVKELPSGMYLLSISDDQSVFKTQKVIKY